MTAFRERRYRRRAAGALRGSLWVFAVEVGVVVAIGIIALAAAAAVLLVF